MLVRCLFVYRNKRAEREGRGMARMISSTQLGIAEDGEKILYAEFAGTSTEEKPTDHLATGSSFLEVDTTNVYFYDEESQTWYLAGGEG